MRRLIEGLFIEQLSLRDEINQFMMITDGMIAVSEGHNIDFVEQALIDDLGEPTYELDDTAPYSHLDQDTAELWAEQDALNRRPDPACPEPDHLTDVDDEI